MEVQDVSRSGSDFGVELGIHGEGEGESHIERFSLVCLVSGIGRPEGQTDGQQYRKTERTANKRALVPYNPGSKGGSSSFVADVQRYSPCHYRQRSLGINHVSSMYNQCF